MTPGGRWFLSPDGRWLLDREGGVLGGSVLRHFPAREFQKDFPEFVKPKGGPPPGYVKED